MAWATDFIHNCRTWTRALRPSRRAPNAAADRPQSRKIGVKPPPIAAGRTAEAAQFQALRQRLLRSFLLVMVTVVGLGSVVAIEFLVHSLYEQLDRQLLLLAQAAGHSLEEIAEEYEEQFAAQRADNAAEGDDEDDDDEDEDEDEEYDPHQKLVKAMRSPGDRAPFLDDRFFDQREELRPRLDENNGLTTPWDPLQEIGQGVEWFSPQGQLLARQGNRFPPQPPRLDRQPQGTLTQGDGLRTFTTPLYDRDRQPPRLRGYVRVTESIEPINRAIRQLGQGLAIGSGLAISLSLVGGLWLTRQSLRPIEASFRKLRQFTADASHELRGPLTAIRTSVEVMQSHPERIDPADVAKLNAIHNATAQMTQLVEDLLLLARRDTPGAVVHQAQPLDLAELLESLLETYGDRAAVQGIDLVSELPPTVVMGEPLLLWRLFGNLLDNALKYTPEGGQVRLTIAPNRRDRRVRVAIEDTGMGIAAADLPHIFDRLWRADQVRSHREGGSGLGLSIAQAIAHSHQGQISVQSQINQGSCFTVTLPLPAPKAAIA
jgi:signal transduction histidine kinase